jgi:hypothetical protein
MALPDLHIDKAALIAERGGQSQAALAAEAGVPLSCVIKGERKGRRTNRAVVVKLAAALGVSIEVIT